MKIVCLGDSFTAGYGVRTHDCWVSAVTEATGFEMINKGVSGDTTSGMMARLSRDVIDLRPDAALLIGGSNDVISSGSTVVAKGNLMAMVHQLFPKGILPILASPVPCDGPAVQEPWSAFYDFTKYNGEIEAFIQWQKKFSKSFYCRYIDVYSAFNQATGSMDNSGLYLDGLHLTPQGHRIVADIVNSALKAMF